MTPQEILELSEPVEQVYTDVVAQLVSNICRHLGQGKELSTQQWEIKKLSELDALTNESIKIIQNASGKSRAEIKRAIAEAMGVGVRDVEKVLKGAERAGAIAGIGFTADQSDALKNLLSNLVNQAEDRANLVNTVMLNSTRNRYVWAVNSTADNEQKLIEKLLSARNAEELNQQLGKVQQALNVATSSVEVGAESRVEALSRTVKQLAQEGITGYIDAGGHHWSPEAYMNMDIRTTVHNAYVQAQKERAAEHGVSTFQITSHAGARPLCAPYQGKFYSWDGSDGVLEDLHGNKHVYESIHATSYGQPAGIFGINCGHDPVTFVNGYSIPRYEPTQDAEQNAKEYAESQKQRQFERNVRQAKLEAIAQDAAGNKEAFKTAAEKVRQANADYKAYCKETGRTPRNDRLQVYASPDGQGYNRSMSGKVTGTTRGWKPTESTIDKSLVSPIDTNNLRHYYGGQNEFHGGERANRFENAIAQITERFTPPNGYGVDIGTYEDVQGWLTETQRERANLFGDVAAAQAWTNYDTGRYVIGAKPETMFGTLADDLERRKRVLSEGGTLDTVFFGSPEGYALHEYGHIMSNYLSNAMIYDDKIAHDYWNWYKTLSKDEIRKGLSNYAATNRDEFEAEAFCEMLTGNPRPLAVKYGEYLKKAIEKNYSTVGL